MCFSSVCAHHRDLHSFPTRRSSDLERAHERVLAHVVVRRAFMRIPIASEGHQSPVTASHGARRSSSKRCGTIGTQRSEEHTSELQSLRHLVCRLLLEKKKK